MNLLRSHRRYNIRFTIRMAVDCVIAFESIRPTFKLEPVIFQLSSKA